MWRLDFSKMRIGMGVYMSGTLTLIVPGRCGNTVCLVVEQPT